MDKPDDDDEEEEEEEDTSKEPGVKDICNCIQPLSRNFLGIS